MRNGRIILKATLTNNSPIGIGSGRDDHSDRDVVTTLYPIDANDHILPPEMICEDCPKREFPFIPATSFMGKIFSYFDLKAHPEIRKYWGESEENASFIDCGDILLTKLPEYVQNNSSYLTEIRDGIRLDSSKGTVAQGAKFDYEVVGSGASFILTMIFRIEEKFNNYNLALGIASAITKIIHDGFDLGAKSTVGFGKMKGEAKLYKLDFENIEHFKQWVTNDLTKNSLNAGSINLVATENQLFEINATFHIKKSLIIRSYSKDPEMPDSTHLKSGGKNVLSGSSIKGALRGRAERILNTIQKDESVTQTIIAGLFGDVKKKEGNKQNGSKDEYTIPSRVFVDEIPIEEVKEEIQTRIQIDRFTGGTVDGALIEEVPLFPVKDKEQIKNFRIWVKDALPLDKGLMLLLLKDLWTADLPIGGEKSVGRGVLEGVKANIADGKNSYTLLNDFENHEKAKELQGYVDLLNNLDNYKFYIDRVDLYKTKKK